MSLKDLARQAGVNVDTKTAKKAAADKKVAADTPVVKDPVVTDTPVVKDPVVKDPVVKDPLTTETPVDAATPGGEVGDDEKVEEKAPATVSDLLSAAQKTKSTTSTKKTSKPRVKVDQAWIESLIEKANERFGGLEEFNKAAIEFTIARSKGRYVSLTPKLVYTDGTIKSAGPKNRVGFCSNEKWDEWYLRLGEAVTAAHSAERKAPAPRKMSGQWAQFSESVKEVLGTEVTIKSVSKKLIIKEGDNRVTLRREGDEAVVGTAAGTLGFLAKVINSVGEAKFSK